MGRRSRFEGSPIVCSTVDLLDGGFKMLGVGEVYLVWP